MGTRLGNASADLFTRLARGAGVTGRYVRGNSEIEVTAIPVRAGNTGTSVEDVVLLDTDAEWLLSTEELVIEGLAFKPKEGDYFVWYKANGTREVYEVLPPNAGERCWTSSNQHKKNIRVYTKYRETVSNG